MFHMIHTMKSDYLHKQHYQVGMWSVVFSTANTVILSYVTSHSPVDMYQNSVTVMGTEARN
jgi:hypothetical protein